MTPATRFMAAEIGGLFAAISPAPNNQDWPLLSRNADMQHNCAPQVINDKLDSRRDVLGEAALRNSAN